MQHSFPEKYVEQKIADIRREVEHNKRVREAKNANISIQGWVVNKMHDMSVELGFNDCRKEIMGRVNIVVDRVPLMKRALHRIGCGTLFGKMNNADRFHFL